MGRAVLILTGNASRGQARDWVNRAPAGTRLEFKHSPRTTPQNARMWAMLTQVAAQVEWHGMKLSADDWKLIFMASLNREMRIVPNLDGTGFVNLGTSSAALTKAEHSDLTMLIEAFAARHDVDLKQPEDA